MKSTALFVRALLVLLLALCSCGAPAREPLLEQPGKIHTLKVVTPSGPSVRAIYEIAESFTKDHPGFVAGVSIISGTTPINAFLTSKFAVGDAPDILIYEGGNGLELFAQGGHLLDLSGRGFEERLIPGSGRYCRYLDGLYALPLDISVSGLFVQMRVLWQGAVRNSELRVVPRNFDEFIASCESLRRAGCRYPVVIGASGDMGASHFLYQYIHQNLYTDNPGLYGELLRGERKWTDPEFREAYSVYEKIREYMNPDALRIDDAEALRRFARGEAAYFIGASRHISGIRRLEPEPDMLLVTPPWTKKAARLPGIFGVDTVISGSRATRFPEEVIAFLDEFTSPQGADIYAGAVNSISSIVDSDFHYDPCLGPRNEIFNGSLTRFFSREWLPGFNGIFRRLNREWFTGRSSESVLEELETAHRRLAGDLGI